MGRNYLQSANGRCNQKSNSDDEAKRYLFCKSGRDSSKSSSSSSDCSRINIIQKRPPKTAIPDIRNNDDIYMSNISYLIGHHDPNDQSISFSRQDNLQKPIHQLQKKPGSERESDQSDSGTARNNRYCLEQLFSPCPTDHTFLVTRFSGQRPNRLVPISRPKATVSTSTDGNCTSTETVNADDGCVLTDPTTVDASTCTICLVTETANAATSTETLKAVQQNESTQTCFDTQQKNKVENKYTQSKLNLIGADLDLSALAFKCHEPPKKSDAVTETPSITQSSELTQTATEPQPKLALNKSSQIPPKKADVAIENMPRFPNLQDSLYLMRKHHSRKCPDPPKSTDAFTETPLKTQSNELTQTVVETQPQLPLNKSTQSAPEKVDAAIENIPVTPKNLGASKKVVKVVESKPETSEEQDLNPKESDEPENIPKPSPRSRKRRGVSRKRVSSAERKRKSSKKRDVPNKGEKYSENIKESSNGSIPSVCLCDPEKSDKSFLRLKKKQDKSDDVGCVEYIIMKPPPNQDDEEKKEDEAVESEPLKTILKNNWLEEGVTESEPKGGIFLKKKSTKPTVRFADKEVSARVINKEKSCLTEDCDSFPCLERVTMLNKETQVLAAQPQEVKGCRKFMRNLGRCLTCHSCK